MQSIDERLAGLEKSHTPPKGLRWAYRTRSSIIGPEDMVCLIDYKGKVFVKKQLYFMNDSWFWRDVAKDVLGLAESEMMRRQYAMPKGKAIESRPLEDLGEKPERRAIEGTPKDKTKGFWGWLYK